MKDVENKTVADCVVGNYKTSIIFKRRGIDYWCNGEISIKDICEKEQINYLEIKEELEDIDENIEWVEDFNNWELDVLIAYIIINHHKYTVDSILLIKEYLNELIKANNFYYKEIMELKELFGKMAKELTKHMCKEEHVLFPYIEQMVQSKKNAATFSVPPFNTIQNLITMMEVEHLESVDLSKQVVELSNSPLFHKEIVFNKLYVKLKEFQENLHEHIHLENNILFPKAIELEKVLLN